MHNIFPSLTVVAIIIAVALLGASHSDVIAYTVHKYSFSLNTSLIPPPGSIPYTDGMTWLYSCREVTGVYAAIRIQGNTTIIVFYTLSSRLAEDLRVEASKCLREILEKSTLVELQQRTLVGKCGAPASATLTVATTQPALPEKAVCTVPATSPRTTIVAPTTIVESGKTLPSTVTTLKETRIVKGVGIGEETTSTIASIPSSITTPTSTMTVTELSPWALRLAIVLATGLIVFIAVMAVWRRLAW